jgi:alkylation response protein AidB-like acyl-CoA dehydrogenase
LIGLSLPRKYGGLNFANSAFVIANEIVARADAGFANIWGLQDCAETINEFARRGTSGKNICQNSPKMAQLVPWT